MSAPDPAVPPRGGLPSQAGTDEPVFPTPWAARAFALAIHLNEQGLFTWPEWAEALGAQLAGHAEHDPADPDDYWRSWTAALEELLARKGLACRADLLALREAWREAAQATPHGEPVELPADLRLAASRGAAPPRGR